MCRSWDMINIFLTTYGKPQSDDANFLDVVTSGSCITPQKWTTPEPCKM